LALGLAFAAAGLPPAEEAALERLRSWRLIRSAGPASEIETYHDRIRKAVLAHLPRPARQGHHRRLASELEMAADLPPAADAGEGLVDRLRRCEARRNFDLAYHFDAAGDSRRALPYALAAAEQARARHALQVAEQQYRIAQRGADGADEADRLRLARGLGVVLALAGRYPEAEEQLLAARSLAAGGAERADVEGELGDLAFKRGDVRAGSQALERALRLLGRRVPRRAWAFQVQALGEVLVQAAHTYLPRLFVGRRPLDSSAADLKAVTLLTRLGVAHFFQRRMGASFWAQLRAMNLAERYPPTVELARCYASHGAAMSMVPLHGRGVTYAEKALAIHETFDDQWGKGQALEFAGVVLHAASRWQEAIEKSRAAIAVLKQTGDPWQQNCSNYQIAVCLYRLGDLGGAVEHSRRLHQDALAIGDALFAGISLSVWARASQGRVPAEVIRAEMDRPSDDPQRTAQVWQAEAVRLLAEGRPLEAAELMERAVQLVRQGGVRNAYVSLLGPWLATSLRLAGQKAGPSSSEGRALLRRARAAAKRGLRLARGFQNDLPHALREAAVVAALRGDPRRAGKLLDESLAVAERQGARYEHAQSLLAQGEIGLRFGRPGAAEQVETARRTLRALESSPSPPSAEDAVRIEARGAVPPMPPVQG
jgi:tetratricopeptide (TPR) repeat protein